MRVAHRSGVVGAVLVAVWFISMAMLFEHASNYFFLFDDFAFIGEARRTASPQF